MKENIKKNRSLIFVLGMIALCLITTCIAGSTLAKYTTGGSSKDGAYIAKWGVKVDVEADSLFKSEYLTTNNVIVVKSNTDGANVIAPGTSSEKANSSAVFSIKGTPEVGTKVTVSMTKVNDIYLKKGTYNDPTGENETFTLSNDYYPVKFTLKQVDNNKVLVSGKLADIQAFLDEYSGTEYAPNVKLDATFELSWEWTFEGNDCADTYLANLMADANAGVNGDNYNLSVSYELKVTVTQIN